MIATAKALDIDADTGPLDTPSSPSSSLSRARGSLTRLRAIASGLDAVLAESPELLDLQALASLAGELDRLADRLDLVAEVVSGASDPGRLG